MKDRIFIAAIEEFDENGIRFTMDSLANRMRVSKRTIYENIPSKEALVSEIIDCVFNDIKDKQTVIANNPELDIIEKLKGLVSVMPQNLPNIDYKKVYEIKKYYPDLYEKIDNHLSTEWETTLALFQQGIEEKKIRNIKVNIIRQIILGTFRNLFDDEFLLDNNLTYEEALNQMIDIIFSGLVIHNDK